MQENMSPATQETAELELSMPLCQYVSSLERCNLVERTGLLLYGSLVTHLKRSSQHPKLSQAAIIIKIRRQFMANCV